MRKRLRKKKHRGEFAEFGREIDIELKSAEGSDEFMWAFIEDAIEANDCYCGGGGSGDRLGFVIELGRMKDNPNGRMERIRAWLDARSDVKSYQVGELKDLGEEGEWND